MNLVEMIQDQFTGAVTSQLGSAIGGSESQTRTAVGAAIPALLAAISGSASSGGGAAEQVASAISRFDSGSLRSLTGLMSDDPEQAVQEGGGLLNSLLGGGPIGALASSISRFTGLDSGMIKKLLALAAPFVMGSIAKQFQGKTVTPQGLTNLFASQKGNIAAVLPSGLSLTDIPGVSDLRATATRLAGDTQRAAGATAATGSSLLKTLVPVAALVLLGFLAWQFLYKPAEQAGAERIAASTPASTTHTVQRPIVDSVPALPDVERMTGDLKSVFTKATDALNGITDAASAEAALPSLNELSKQVGGIDTMNRQLPAAARSPIAAIIGEQLGPLTQLIDKVLAIPGVKEKLEPVLNQLRDKFTELGK